MMAGLAVPTSASAAPPPATIKAARASVNYTFFGWHGKAVSEPVVLSGTFTDAVAGEKAQLLWKPFPFTGAEQVGPSKALSVARNHKAPFSFSVQPETATEYSVNLLNPDGSVNGTFALETLYVVSTRSLGAGKVDCIGNTCHISFTLLRFLPVAVSTAELAKPYYDYLGLSFSGRSTPAPPTFMYRKSGWTVSKTTAVPRVASEYETTFRLSFHLAKANYSYVADACTIDSESTDGFGLPGHHACGNARVPVTTSYLG
ncbi:MAG: hypothetical protein ABSB54_04705 [Acidimicrobiales bacterium]|jgi:hypothetical protein